MEAPNGPDDTSWWDELINAVKPQQVPPPPAPQPPSVNQGGWEKSVEQARISDSLGSVHDLGLVIFSETQSYSDRSDSSEPLDTAREKMAHAIMNADQKWGFDRQKKASTALPIEPSVNALSNPSVRAAYASPMKAAREAYLSGTDPTNGALYLNQRPTPDRSNLKFKGGLPEGVPISTHAGPYNNSFPNKRGPFENSMAEHFLATEIVGFRTSGVVAAAFERKDSLRILRTHFASSLGARARADRLQSRRRRDSDLRRRDP